NILVQFACCNVMYIKLLLEYLVRFLIRKPTIAAHHDRCLFGVSLAYEIYYRAHPVGVICSMIGMSAPFSKGHVYQKRAPAYMKRLKPFFTLVSNLATFAFHSI